MAAVEDAYDPVAVREFGEDGGGEALGGFQPVAPGALARQGPLQPLGDRLQGRFLFGGLPERPDDDGDGRHRPHPLAPHVPEDDPYAVRGVLHGVQVTADERALMGGLVPGGDLERADARLRFGQYGALHGLGDLAGRGEAPVAPAHHPVDDDGQDRDRGHGDRLGDRVGVRAEPEAEVHDVLGEEGCCCGDHRGAQRGERGGDERGDREEGDGGEVTRGGVVVHDPGDDQERGQDADEGPHP